MGCGVYWRQVNRVSESLDVMRRSGISASSPAFQQLFSLRGKLLGQVGVKYPREVTMMLKIMGLSPGSVTLWHDLESGWMSEARESPGAPPVYKLATNEVAMTLLKGEMTKELELELMAPDDYLGE